jgi:hypothetical protein
MKRLTHDPNQYHVNRREGKHVDAIRGGAREKFTLMHVQVCSFASLNYAFMMHISQATRMHLPL